VARKPVVHKSKGSPGRDPNKPATRNKTDPMANSKGFKALVLDSLGEMLFYLDRDLRVRWSSEYAGGLVRSSAKDLVGKFCYDLWCQRPRPCLDCPSLRAMETGQIQQNQISSADGKIWDVHSYPVCDDAGRVIGATEFRQDITERKNAEKALFESEKRYKVIWDNIDDIIYVISSDRKVVSVNPACAKITGWPVEYWIGKDMTPYIHPEDLSKANDQMRRFLQAEKVNPTELHILTRNGEYRTVEFKPAALFKDGDLTQISGIGRDVTERVIAERALRESEEKFRNLTEQSPNMIFITRGGKVVYANRKCEEITEYGRNELYADDFDFLDLIAPEFVDLIIRNYGRHLQGIEVAPCECALITKAGNRVEAIMTTKLISYEGENSTLGIVTDITERKAAEKLLHEKDRELMQKTRSLEEMNTALGVLLEQREKEKVDFKENIFVNLKKLVFPYIEKLESKKLDEESQTYLNIVRSNLKDLMAPIANALTLKYIDFTPTEIQVANLITQEKTSKEIASMLNVSTKAVSFHRANIRKKLGLSNKKANLRTFLQSFPAEDRRRYQ
jgi:PAS domain S-box-containing protein